MLETIVTGWDGTEGARDALALAGALSPTFGGLVTAAYVSPLTTERASLDGFEEVIAEDAASVLFEAREAGVIDPDRLSLRLVPGASPVQSLADLSASLHADLLVVGSDRRAGVGRVLAGGVARRLLLASPCPVAVAPAGYRESGPAAPRVVAAAFDGSAGARAAVAVAERIAIATRATMRVVAVDEHWYPGTDITLTQRAAGGHEDLRAALDEIAAGLDPRVRAQAKLLGGNAFQKLLEEAALGVDLLVLGSRGLGVVKRALLGSVSGEMVRHAPCPVIVVPSDVEGSPASGPEEVYAVHAFGPPPQGGSPSGQ